MIIFLVYLNRQKTEIRCVKKQRNTRCAVAQPTTCSRHRRDFPLGSDTSSTTVQAKSCPFSLALTRRSELCVGYISWRVVLSRSTLAVVVVKSIEKCRRDGNTRAQNTNLNRMRIEPTAGWRIRETSTFQLEHKLHRLEMKVF